MVAALSVAFSALADPSGGIFDRVGDALATVQCEDAAGVGFVCELDGAKFLIVNRHVVEGQKRVAAFLTDGREFRLGKLQEAKDVDLVRFEVRPEQPAVAPRNTDLKKNEQFYMFRPGAGRDAQAIRGRVIEARDGRLEVSHRFELPMSGSPIFDVDGKVVGVASMEPLKGMPKNWVRQGYQSANPKQFALCVTGNAWEASSLDALARRLVQRRHREQVAAGTLPEVVATFSSPSMRINRQVNGGKLLYFVNGTVVLGFSGSRKFKNPLVRIAAFVDCNGLQFVFDAFTQGPNGGYDLKTLPIWSYGMPAKNNSYRLNNGDTAIYLEGLSFYQPSSAVAKMKGIDYFDRKSLTTGGIELPAEITKRCDAANPPKIIAFRLECWQNGSLAGCYNSARPDTLNSKMIPVDWFVIGKYPDRFTYK